VAGTVTAKTHTPKIQSPKNNIPQHQGDSICTSDSISRNKDSSIDVPLRYPRNTVTTVILSPPLLDEKGEEDIVKRSLCDKCGRELGKLREDNAWLCDACYAVSRLKADWTEDLTQEEIIELLVQLGLTPAEAKHFFEDRLAGTALLWYDKTGKTVWRRA